jgi:G:T-mismatch repair DNA endonuclease (very short patch repair protein)
MMAVNSLRTGALHSSEDFILTQRSALVYCLTCFQADHSKNVRGRPTTATKLLFQRQRRQVTKDKLHVLASSRKPWYKIYT